MDDQYKPDKISDVIKNLQEYLDIHGDLPVYKRDWGSYEDSPVYSQYFEVSSEELWDISEKRLVI